MFGTFDPSQYDPQALSMGNIAGGNPYAQTSLTPQQPAPMLGQMPAPPPPIPVAAPAKPNFFAPDQTGGRIADALGYLGAGLSRAGGGQDIITPIMERRQQLQYEMSKQGQQQQLEYQRQLALEQYKHANPETPAEVRAFQAYQAMTPEQKRQYDAFKPIIQMGQYGAQVFTRAQINASINNGGAVAPSRPSAAAIDHLRQNPALADAFDAKYGPGSSRDVLGGPSQPATGGFP